MILGVWELFSLWIDPSWLNAFVVYCIQISDDYSIICNSITEIEIYQKSYSYDRPEDILLKYDN